jgi:predicted negative regulator of RcsB-dependent stress response
MPNSDDLLREGIEAEKKSDPDHAERRYLAVLAAQPGDAVLAETHCRLSSLYRNRCQWDLALQHAKESGRLALRLEDKKQFAEALNAEALVHHSRGDFEEARHLLDQILTVTDDARLRGFALQNLGSISANQGDLGSAERYFAESYGCFMRAGFPRGEALSLNNYGRAALDRGNLALADEVLCKAVELSRVIEDSEMIALATLNYAEAVARKGNLGRAEDLASSALGYFAHTGNTWRHIECLRLLGDIHLRSNKHTIAQRCYEEGLDLAKRIGARVETTILTDALRAIKKR